MISSFQNMLTLQIIMNRALVVYIKIIKGKNNICHGGNGTNG